MNSSLGAPRLHSALARSLYDRMLHDEELRNYDKNVWYTCNLGRVDEELCARFVQLSCDQETQHFLDTCFHRSDWIFTQIYHVIMKALLTWFMTNTSINGLLNRGSMFVLSSCHVAALLQLPASLKADLLLDLGAGDGGATDKMASFFKHVHVTEISPVMRKVLANKGYRVLDADSWSQDDGGPLYDVISCFNVLDRCQQPITMLRSMRRKLKPGTGRIIVALVLPYSPGVESGKQLETLPVAGATFEDQVVSFRNILSSEGLRVVSWSRVPYLCQGDLKQAYYWLDDSIFILQADPQ